MFSLKIFLCFSTLFLLIAKSTSNPPDPFAEEFLVREQLKNYNPLRRPDAYIGIGLVINLREIQELDEKNQIMTSTFLVQNGWWDNRFKWKPDIFNNLRTILIPAKRMWYPDLFIDNIVGSNGFVANDDFLTITIDNESFCLLQIPLYSVKTKCPMNLLNYPFDKQICSITFRTYSHASNRLYFYDPYGEVLMDEYKSNPKWILSNTSIKILETSATNIAEEFPYSAFQLEVHLTRNSNGFMKNVIVPFYIINAVAIICFLLPYSQQIICCFLCNLAFLLNYMRVSNDIPVRADDPPKINQFFVLSFAFNLVPILWFVLCNFIKERDILPKVFVKAWEYIVRCVTLKEKINKVNNEEVEIYSLNDDPSNPNNNRSASAQRNKDLANDLNKINERKSYETVVSILNLIIMVIFVCAVIIGYQVYWKWFNKNL